MLLVFPDNLTGESPMTWQVIDGMRYSMVDEADRGATPRGREEEEGQTAINIASSAATLPTRPI